MGYEESKHWLKSRLNLDDEGYERLERILQKNEWLSEDFNQKNYQFLHGSFRVFGFDPPGF